MDLSVILVEVYRELRCVAVYRMRGLHDSTKAHNIR